MNIPHTLLNYAFRPFFLLGAFSAILVMALWSLALLGFGPVTTLPSPMLWHAHEMLFGFVLAVVAGFVLTAVAAWTERAPLTGAPLAWLAAAWLAGRIAVIAAGRLPAVLVAAADMVFPLLLVVFFGREVVAAGNRRNYGVVGIVGAVAVLNLLYHYGATGSSGDLDRTVILLTIHVILVLITVIAGRIVPSFTANWLRSRGRSRLPVSSLTVERATLAMTAVTGLMLTWLPDARVTGSAALLTAALHAIRLSRWRGWSTRTEPLLFVLHVAYAWLPIGYALTAWSAFASDYPSVVALHALTMGAIGSMILAMITRVSLGHTGRPLHAPRVIVFAYFLLTVVVLIRIAGPLTGSYYMAFVEIATLGWMLVFALFIGVYWPILTAPRTEDAQPDG